MTGGPGLIDWNEEVRGERRKQLLVVPVAAAFPVGTVLLTGHFLLWRGGAAWLAAAVFLALLAASVASTRLVPLQRRSVDEACRIYVALRRRVDPGPELRSRTDQLARYQARSGWVGWAALLGAVGLLVGARWSHPVTAALGTVLIAGLAIVWSAWWYRRTQAARRWMADPPGPAREFPAPTTAERWLTGRRGLLLLLGFALVALAVPLLIIAFR